MQPWRAHPAGWLILLWLATATLAARIGSFPSMTGASDTSAVALLADETRQALGQHLYRTSDIYFHRGGRPRPQAPYRNDRLTRLSEAISPNQHEHLDEHEIAQIMPWLLATVRADASHVEAWRVTAFWLASPALAKTEEAATLLADAARRHPDDYRPLLDLARLRLRRNDLAGAVWYLDRGLALWRDDLPRLDQEEARMEKAELLMFRALCDEIDGNFIEAAAGYDRILRMFPDRHHLAERRDALRTGQTPELPPLSWIRNLAAHRHLEPHECEGHRH